MKLRPFRGRSLICFCSTIKRHRRRNRIDLRNLPLHRYGLLSLPHRQRKIHHGLRANRQGDAAAHGRLEALRGRLGFIVSDWNIRYCIAALGIGRYFLKRTSGNVSNLNRRIGNDRAG